MNCQPFLPERKVCIAVERCTARSTLRALAERLHARAVLSPDPTGEPCVSKQNGPCTSTNVMLSSAAESRCLRCMQALQCLVNILRALVEWYTRAVPSLEPTGGPGGVAGEEAPRTDWQPLTSKQSQDLAALAARASGSGLGPGLEPAATGEDGAAGPAPADALSPAGPDGDAAGAHPHCGHWGMVRFWVEGLEL